MSASAWLLVRRSGCLWALRADQVRGVAAGAGLGARIEVGEGVVVGVDEVVGLERQLEVRAGAVFRSVAPRGCSGMGVCAAGPVLVVEESSLPAALGGRGDGQGEGNG